MTNFINNLASSYPNTPNCLASDKRGDFWISEDEKTKKSYIVPSIPEQEEQEAMLKINNPHTKDINLLCIDACLFSSADSSRCDCALFDDDKFCFCELKFDVKNMGTASRNLQKARNLQLSNTISALKSQIDFTHFSKLEAYIVLRKRLYPRQQARLTSLKTEFWDKHQVDYFEEKEIIFDTPVKKNEKM